LLEEKTVRRFCGIFRESRKLHFPEPFEACCHPLLLIFHMEIFSCRTAQPNRTKMCRVMALKAGN